MAAAGGTIELTGAAFCPACACWGVAPRRVWGKLHDADGTTAYVVQWSPGARATHGAAFDFVFGPWDAASSAADRFHVAVAHQRIGQQTTFDIIDAATSPIDARSLAARALRRDEVMGQALAERVLFYVDQVWVRDARIAELHTA